jgi:four helix bundle protein
MEKIKKIYDLEDRIFEFAKAVRDFVKSISKIISNIEYGKQLIRSSASVGANYIEANESLGKKDFLMRIRISRKEAKESRYWLRLITINKILKENRNRLVQESTELINIFGSIITKSK